MVHITAPALQSEGESKLCIWINIYMIICKLYIYIAHKMKMLLTVTVPLLLTTIPAATSIRLWGRHHMLKGPRGLDFLKGEAFPTVFSLRL